MSLALAIGVGTLLVGGGWWGFLRWRRQAAQNVPVASVGALLGAEEKLFLDAARRALVPDFDIFAKVSLGDVVRPAPSASAILRGTALASLRAEHADFVVCRPDNGHILGVIELNTSGVERTGSSLADGALARAGVPVLHIEARKQYDATFLRQQALATFRPPQRAAAMRSVVRRGTVWLRVDGHGTFQNSPALRAFAEKMVAAGHHSFAFDLQGCDLMDSTFLGTLTGLALRLREDPRGRIAFAHVNERIEQMFVRYGLDRVLTFQGFEAAAPAAAEMEELSLAASKDDARLTLVEAHEALAASSAENKERFGEVVDFLKHKE